MNSTRQRIASWLTLTFIALMLLGCGAALSTSRPQSIPAPGIIESNNPDYANAQATIDSGQNQLSDLSRKATEVSLNMSQAANAEAQATQEYNQRQQMEVDHQATVIGLNIARAEATQQFIKQQTKIAGDATDTARSRAATATHSAFLVNVTRTAQAQAILDAHALQTDQAVAALTGYPLTATPYAATQAALLMLQYDREKRSFVDQVVTPLIPILATILGLLLFILIIVLVYRWFMLMWWPHRLRIARLNANPSPHVMIDGVITDHDPQLHHIFPSEPTPASPPGLPDEITVHVEIVNATEPPVAHWIAEVERQLAAEGGR